MREVTGNLRFLADRTLPNILASTSLLSSGAHNPSTAHKAGGEQALKYLKLPSKWLCQSRRRLPHQSIWICRCISYHGPWLQISTRICFYLNETSRAVIEKSKRDTTISHSSTEAEIKAIDLAICEATWFRGFLSELGYSQDSPTIIYADIPTKALPFTVYEKHSTTLMHGHNGLPPTISTFTGNDKIQSYKLYIITSTTVYQSSIL